MSEPFDVIVLDDSAEFSLADLCSACRLEQELVLEIVAEGIVEPRGAGPADWRFSGPALVRIQRVVRLQRDFDVNVPGAALVLELLDELEQLRRAGGRVE